MDIVGLFQGLVGLGTVVAGGAAIWAAYETRKLRVEQRLPDLIAYLDKNNSGILGLDLVIENIGAGPAYKVKMTADRDYEEPQITKLKTTSLMSDEGISILPPTSTRRFVLGSSGSIGNHPRHYNLVYYQGREDDPGEPIRVPVTLRTSDFDGMMYTENTQRKAQKATAEAMRKLSSGDVKIEIEPSWRFQEWLDRHTGTLAEGPTTEISVDEVAKFLHGTDSALGPDSDSK